MTNSEFPEPKYDSTLAKTVLPLVAVALVSIAGIFAHKEYIKNQAITTEPNSSNLERLKNNSDSKTSVFEPEKDFFDIK
jgi:hypothetical protein